MSPTDKNKPTENSASGESQTPENSKCHSTDCPSDSASSSSSNVTIPGHGMIANIPLITASLPTLKCSINDQMKTFDPGEEGGIERLAINHCGNTMLPEKNSCSSSSNSNSSCLVKSSTKNYKAGSKINKLADMLAKRSQNVVEVTQNNSPEKIPDSSSAYKVEDALILNNVCNIINFVHKNSENSRARSFEKTANGEELEIFRKSRRKSVPNQSCNLQRLQDQSTSKSCSDFSKLFPLEENGKLELNALGGSPLKLQTDECTKKKASRKNLKNVELPHILPERKRRSSLRNENLVSKKVIEKVVDVPSEETSKVGSEEINTSSIQSPIRNVNSTKLKKEGRVKVKKSKRLVETSTQTADIEFISVLKPKLEVRDEKSAENEKTTMIYECLYCTQTFVLGSECKAHEKTHSTSSKQLIKCQYCSKKLPSLDELKSHCIQKHPNKYAYCMKCDERFVTKEELYVHNKDIHLNKSGEGINKITEEGENEKKREEPEEKLTDKKSTKQNNAKTDLKIDVSFDSSKKSSVSPRNVQKGSPKDSKTEEQLLEMEMLFYSHLSGNIQENLANHLDGKIDKSGNPVRTNQISEPVESSPSKNRSSSLLSVVTPSTGVPDVQVSRAPSPYQTRSKTPNPLPPTAKKFKKLPNWQQKFWEKYNFPTNYRYEHRFWDKNYLNTEKSAFYLKDLSCLDIKTQLTMRENIKKLDSIKQMEENSKSSDKMKFPNYLSLMPRVNANTKEQEALKGALDNSKNKRQLRKEETKKSFKSPGTELPVVKTRRKLSSDNSSGSKRPLENGNTEGLKMMTRRQSSLDLMKEDKEEEGRKRKGSLDNSFSQRMTLRRQTSLDNLQENSLSKIEKNNRILELSLSKLSSDSSVLSPPGSAEISGEWVRPRSYLCGTCCTKFTNLWELEDHKWVSHPNVWCTHYEFEDEKIDKLFQNSEAEVAEVNDGDASSKLKLTDLYKRYLLPYGSLKTAKLVPSTNFPEQCTKCKKNCTNSSEMHKHMLDCGGDTTWFLTMYSSPMTIKRKWRPFGSRRRKQIGRRDIKRNIPSTPTLRSYHYQHRIRTKPGDVESIQKMLANLPEKRARRAINFDEIKTRSQATIHSNRLLRKRFKSTFTSNFLKLKNLKQKRPLKPVKKEGSSKSATDISSESTPVGSPKRKNKVKEGAQSQKEEDSREGTNENSGDAENKSAKKKNQNRKIESGNTVKSGIEIVKIGKTRIKSEKLKKKGKPCTRSKSTAVVDDGPKSKESVVKEEVEVDQPEVVVQNGLKNPKEVSKMKKKIIKKNKKSLETVIKKEVEENVEPILEVNPDVVKVEHNKNVEESSPAESQGKKSYWVKAQRNSTLRLKQNRNKTEILKKIKKKITKSKQVLNLQKLENGSRRSLRIKSLHPSQTISQVTDSEVSQDIKKEESVPLTDLKLKKPVVNIKNMVGRPSKKIGNKSPKNSNKNLVKETSNSEESVIRKSPRSLRNSTSSDEKSDILSNGESFPSPVDLKKVSPTRRNSKSLSESTLPSSSDIEEEFSISKKPLQVINMRHLRAVEDKPEAVLVNGEIPIPKGLLQNTNVSNESSKLEESPHTKKNYPSKCNDLEEMPVLAKVEPIRGKISGKGEKEIPVLLPVEEEEGREDIQEKTPKKKEDVVSFEVIKKRKKTSKEVTPLKIVKKVERVSREGENGFQIKKKKSFQENSEPVKTKRKKFATAPVVPEKKTKNDIKKYFLGICPIEIDKGRSHPPDESGSDSEPLISLVINQPQKETSSNKIVEKIKDIVGKDQEPLPIEFEKKRKKKKDIEKKVVEEFTSPPEPLLLPETLEDTQKVVDQAQREKLIFSKSKETSEIRKIRKQRKIAKKSIKRLRMTVTLKEPTLKIIDKPFCPQNENKWTIKVPEEKTEVESQKIESSVPSEEIILETSKEGIMPERRSRRISKETKSTTEFRIDDPLILVDELWSELDSDSDSSKKKTKKTKKKSFKKKASDEKKVNLEELLRNFGENKDMGSKTTVRPVLVKLVNRREKVLHASANVRKAAEMFQRQKSYRRLSLSLFRFNKSRKNFGNKGERLSDAKKALRQRQDEIQRKSNRLPDLPFLAAEIKENPVQVIQCRAQKPKAAKRILKKSEPADDIHLKISLPLESINNLAVFNNNHLTELVLEEPIKSGEVSKEVSTPEESLIKECPTSQEEGFTLTETPDGGELKNKPKRSEVIDKIFYCEICKTYYYSSSQLKIHKLSNRHKVKESKFLMDQQKPEMSENKEPEGSKKDAVEESVPPVEKAVCESSKVNEVEPDKLNEDTLEMPTLEGPFIESPLARLVTEPVEPAPQPPVVSSFGFSQESLKDIQRAIGCTDEEMLILTLLGENTVEIENDILNLDTCKPVQSKSGGNQTEKVEVKESEKTNGALKLDLKQRMTSALACLVNKAVYNLLQKYETAAKSAVNPEALSLLGKLQPCLSRRKNILQLNELLKKQNDGETSIGSQLKELERKEPTVSYKYQCTICGSRFEKASTRECHINRSHKGKAKKQAEEAAAVHTPAEDDWNDSWSYDANDDHLGSNNSSQFWCSDCGINFLSPQEVFEHQKLEHQAGLKNTEQTKESGPLQSSTIGSSDEIMEGKKPRRRPKFFSTEELDQQRIIANNELRKLDRKFSSKSKANKIKWGMDALRFTVEKENKMVVVQEEKEVTPEDSEKVQIDVKNIDLVPKLNLSRTNNIPEFKVIQKNSFKNRFQKIIDNKLRRKSNLPSQQEPEVETEVMLVPVVVKKKNKKQKPVKSPPKKEQVDKPLDIYDFNESESEGEPIMYSHVKKPAPSPTKFKLVKVKEGPSKNKADSTTKDLAPDDYDSEDSLPLSLVKKVKVGDEDDEKEVKISEDEIEKSEGILEQVEYLIEQLENETGSSINKSTEKNDDKESDADVKKNATPDYSKAEVSKNNFIESPQGSLRVSVANKFLELDNIPLKHFKGFKDNEESANETSKNERVIEPEDPDETILAEPESSHSTFDEEDSMPLVLMSKKADKPKEQEEKKSDDNTTDVSTTASEDVQIFRTEGKKSSFNSYSPEAAGTVTGDKIAVEYSPRGNETFSEKLDKPFETVNGNVIYCRNDSVSDFCSDFSNDGLIHSNFEKTNSEERDQDFLKEVTEKEDVVIVCSKGNEDESDEGSVSRKPLKPTQREGKETMDGTRKKKKRFPLLTATIEENNFRNSESPKLNKEVIVRKIWSRRKIAENSTDNDEDSFTFVENENSVDALQNDESQTEIEKEVIVKKIWSRKKMEHDDEFPTGDKVQDVKINQTEISDEVVIKCGPKTKSPKRRKSKSCNSEASKETIMRKIWSGKCTFQTKAALKTYDSDMIPNCKENEVSEERKPKKRGRPAGVTSTKRSKCESEVDKDEDDLDSLLEEIEREQLEKAIRLEFLQLRRSEKGNVDSMKEGNPTVGLFAETSLEHKKQVSEKKRRKVKKKIKLPKQSVVQKRKYIKKPIRRVVPVEEKSFSENTSCPDPRDDLSDVSVDKSSEAFGSESKIKNRKHKKHRHRHHHHKHKHKKSKHRKCIISKRKSKHNKFESEDRGIENSDSFTILKKICQDIPNQIENEVQLESKNGKKKASLDLDDIKSKLDDGDLLPFGFDNKSKNCSEVGYDEDISDKKRFESEKRNMYDFVDDVPDFAPDGLKKCQNVRY